MRKTREGKTRRGARGRGAGCPGSSNRRGRGGRESGRNLDGPARTSSPVVRGAQGGSPATAEGPSTDSKVALRGTGGDGGGAVANRSTRASHMIGHGATRAKEPSDGQEFAEKPKDVTDHDIVTSGASKLAAVANVKADKELDTAESAAVVSSPATNAKTAAATVVATTSAAVDAGSTAAVSAAPAAETTVKPVGAGLSTTVNIAPTAAGDVSEVAAVPVATVPTAKVTHSGLAPAAAVKTVVVAVAAAIDASPDAPAAGTTGKAVGVSRVTAVNAAPTAAGALAGDVAVPVEAAPAAMAAQSVQAPATAAETAVVAVAVAIDAIPAVDASPAADVDVRPAAVGVDSADEGGAMAVGTANGVVAEAAVVADAVPAAADDAIAAGTGDAAAEAAVAASKVVVAATTAAVDSDDEKSENGVPAMERGEPEAAEEAGPAAEPSPLVAAAGRRIRRTNLELASLLVERIGKWFLIVYVFGKLVNKLVIDDDPHCRGTVLYPGHSPLLPGDYIEGTTGLRQLGWLPGFSHKPKLVMSGAGEMIAKRPDGSEIIVPGDGPEGKGSMGFLCGVERLVRGVARMDAPEYDARSRQGRLVLGREYFFCRVEALPTASSTMDLALQWLEGGDGGGDGAVRFSDDGDVEMMARSGEVVWSLAQGQGGNNEKEATAELKPKKSWMEKRRDELRKKMKNTEGANLKTADERKRVQMERAEAKLQKAEESKRRKAEIKEAKKKKAEDFKRRQEERKKAKQSKKGKHKSLFGWNDSAADDAATDNASSPPQEAPPRQSVFGRVFRSAGPSPNGAGGQSG